MTERIPWRVVAIAASALIVAAGVILVRAATMVTPRLQVRTTLARAIRFPGKAPTLTWPTAGEAAVSVRGVGDMGEHGGDAPEPIASVAKMMTAYLILRDHPLKVGQKGFTVRITAAEVNDEVTRAAQGQSTIRVAKGEVLDEYQMVEALLIPSANNIAAILATYDAGSVTAFVAKMNAAAKALHMTHTEYTDPSGFTATTVSTATDQLRLAKVVMRDPVFAGIAAMKKVTLPVAGTVNNYNSLVGTNGFVGVKTGSDSQAGGCLVFANRRITDGRRVLVLGVVLGQDRHDSNTATILAAAAGSASALTESVSSALSVRDVIPAGRSTASFTDAGGDRVVARTTRAVRRLGWGGLRLRVRVSLDRPSRSLARGQRVGTVAVGGGAVRSVTPVTATTAMPSLTFGWRLSHVF